MHRLETESIAELSNASLVLLPAGASENFARRAALHRDILLLVWRKLFQPPLAYFG